jgi:hypothetical protein
VSLAENTKTLKRPTSPLERALALSREVELPAVEELFVSYLCSDTGATYGS